MRCSCSHGMSAAVRQIVCLHYLWVGGAEQQDRLMCKESLTKSAAALEEKWLLLGEWQGYALGDTLHADAAAVMGC